LPLSFVQQRLWFFDQLEPKSPVYNRAAFLLVRGRLDKRALQSSVNEIVRRHEVVRTTFTSVEGRPKQVVSPPGRVALPIVDLSELPEAIRQTEAKRLAVEESLRPFDLTSDVLLRIKILQLGEEENLLILSNHHIAFDGWSDAILYQELATLYKAYIEGLPSPLAELPIQYADFAVWQRASLRGSTLEKHVTYWKRQLAGAPSLWEVPTGRPRPAFRTFCGSRHAINLSENLSDALRIFSRQENVTLFMTLLAAFQTLLRLYTGRHDIVIGTPVAGRSHVETESLIGAFINTLALRADLSGNPTFRELLRRVREVCVAAYAHSDLPFEKLVEALQPARDLSRNTLFQVMFQLRNTPGHKLELPDATVEQLEFDSGMSKLDLALEVIPNDRALTCLFEYNTDLFDFQTIERLARCYHTLLEALVANPERPLVDLAAILEPLQAVDPSHACGESEKDIYERSNLTRTQLLFWAGQKLRPEAPLYNVPYAFYLKGEIDYDHFQNAFQTLLNSSDALRTVICEFDGIPQQSVAPEFPYTVEFWDFSDCADPGAAAGDWLAARSRLRFDLRRGLFDCALVKLSERQFVWFLNVHHIIVDGRSIELIVHRQAEFYQRSLGGCLEKTAELPRFKHYVEAQRESRCSVEFRQIESYWKTKLGEPFEPLRFYGRGSDKKGLSSKRISCELGWERTLKLKHLAARGEISVKTEHASMFNIFATALLTYLYRVTGSRSPSIAVPFHNRKSKDFHSTIGLLMEIVPLRVAVEESDSFVSLNRKIAREAYESFQSARFIGASPGGRGPEVLLNYDPLSIPRFGKFPVQTERLYLDQETLSLVLRIRDYNGEGFVVDFEFHRDVFDESERRRAVQHFIQILDAFLEKPDEILDRVALLNEEERKRVLVDFNRSHRDGYDGLDLLQLFEDQVHKTPDHPAVICDNQSISFARLNSKANQLAHYLLSLRVKPGAPVGISMDRSLEMVVGLMGILKAGAAYVPLEPTNPKERTSLILADMQMPALLSRSRLAGTLPDQSARLICLDSDSTSISRMSGEAPLRELTPDHLAYIIYTSGSTGRPKGVEVTHGALANFVAHAGDTFALGPGDRVLQFASIGFDAAVEEIFPCLIRGATLVLRTDTMLDSVSMFLQKCRDWEITVLDLPTAYWHELTETIWRQKLSLPASLRLVIIGGEKAIPERLIQWQGTAGGEIRLLNTYGPTEGTVVATIEDLTEWTPLLASAREVPIGRPIANIQTYILDKRLNPTPIGVPGELHIGGAGLARGYRNRADLTAEKFIPDPFTGRVGARLYKTGDIARFLADGKIAFVGRIDAQVKIRGFRIELGEIEAVLREHPGVRDVSVIARNDASAERLVAYVVPERDVSVSVSELRHTLKKKLPEYMVPSSYVLLESLPLTAGGKLDRRGLPEPGQTRPDQDNPFIPPATREEEIIAGIWARVLRLDRVGIHDNFFDLGGHSLLATQVVSRMKDAFRVELPLRVVFEHPTVAGLAERLEAICVQEPAAGLVNVGLEVREEIEL
jgi:amino acid adenylation domain-containing protein